jgi:hypothetical protein
MTELGEFAMWAAAGAMFIGFWIAVSPIFKAIAGRIASGGRAGTDRIQALEDRLAALEQVALTSGEVEAQYARLSDVEERLDFAERMLTVQTSLPSPTSERP